MRTRKEIEESLETALELESRLESQIRVQRINAEMLLDIREIFHNMWTGATVSRGDNADTPEVEAL